MAQGAAFAPPAALRHRHLQSVLTQAPWRRSRARQQSAGLVAAASSRIVDCGDGVRLGGYLSEADGPSPGLVLLLHGWEGSADSSYVLSVGSALLAAGFSVFRLNLRDHGGTHALNEELFHSCRIEEVFNAVAAVRAQSEAPFFAVVGQSLGGNFALRIAARAADAGLAVDRIVAVCPVLRPHHTMHALDHGLWIYRQYFLARWRQSLAAKAAAFPSRYAFGDLRRFRTLTATTRFFVEQYTEFSCLDDYLNGYAVTGAALANIRVPTRIILAADDPMIPVVDLANLARPQALQVTLVDHGGHCGFIDRLLGSSWVDREIVADLKRGRYAALAV
jgi:predicted alpha/beta-fold hydrolase